MGREASDRVAAGIISISPRAARAGGAGRATVEIEAARVARSAFSGGDIQFSVSSDRVASHSLIGGVVPLPSMAWNGTVVLGRSESATNAFASAMLFCMMMICGLIWFVVLSACALTVLRDTSEGCDEIVNWPGHVFLADPVEKNVAGPVHDLIATFRRIAQHRQRTCRQNNKPYQPANHHHAEKHRTGKCILSHSPTCPARRFHSTPYSAGATTPPIRECEATRSDRTEN